MDVLFHNRRRQGTTVIVLLTCLAVLSGCGASDSQEADVPDQISAATADIINLPTELYTADNLMTSQCARSLGYDIPLSFTPGGQARGYADVGGVFRSQDEATSTGYPSDTVNQEQGIDALDAYLNTLPQSQRQHFETLVNGDLNDDFSISTSCFAISTRWLYGSWQRYEELSNTYNDYAKYKSDSTLRDEEVSKAISGVYVPCMKNAGYTVNGLRAGALASKRFGRYRSWNDAPHAQEQKMAKQDYECQIKAKLIDKLDTAMERTAGKWMLENESVLLARHEQLGEAMVRAKQVISGQTKFETIKSAA